MNVVAELGSRYYDPEIGRFISEDPAMDGSNWYAYCGNNPVNYVDPSGLDSVIFVDEGMENQAYIRSSHYSNKYGTNVKIYYIESAQEFVASWNKWVELGKETEAVEIICHGGAVGDVGAGVGFLDFGNESQIFARDIDGKTSVIELNYLKAIEININACNSANPDIYNIT